MTESDIKALNECKVGESVTVTHTLKRVSRSDGFDCTHCAVMLDDECDALNCGNSVFVEVSNDQ